MSEPAKILTVQEHQLHLTSHFEQDYFNLTEMARCLHPQQAELKKWLNQPSTLEFLRVWEQLNNKAFDKQAAQTFNTQYTAKKAQFSVKRWIATTHAQGLITQLGRTGGVLAHYEIAFEFVAWLKPSFKLALIKALQAHKTPSVGKRKDAWNLRRSLTKTQYRLHTNAIQKHLIQPNLSTEQISFIYSCESDLLNMAVFGHTAREWRAENPDKSGNSRDFASIEQLVVLGSLESRNAQLIQEQKSTGERLAILSRVAQQHKREFGEVSCFS